MLVSGSCGHRIVLALVALAGALVLPAAQAHAEPKASEPAALVRDGQRSTPFFGEAWLATVREDGAQHGLEAYARRVFRTSSGRYYVPEESERTAILKLREDRALAARITRDYQRRCEILIEERIGRVPGKRERQIDSHRKQENRDQLHQHVGHFQTDNV